MTQNREEPLQQYGHTVVLFDDMLGNLQQADIRFRTRLWAVGDNPQMAVERGLKVRYQLFAKTALTNMEHNCIEVYQREDDGVGRVIHSTWSFIRPMDKNFRPLKK